MSNVAHLVTGQGPPLVVLLFVPRPGTLTGISRWSVSRLIRPLASRFTVHLLNRPRGLPDDSTMADIATVYANGITHHVGEPVDLLGISTGGAIALQLAVDHPHTVGHLALAATAHSLGPVGHEAQRQYVVRARAGDRPSPALLPVVTTSSLIRPLVAAALWLGDGRADHADAATLLNAENTSTVDEQIHRISSPTLLVSGNQDRVYPHRVAQQTARLIPNTTHITCPGCGHEQVLRDHRLVSDLTAFLSVNQ